MKKVFLVYGHYNDKSFNSAIKDNFIKSARENGHVVECVDLYREKFDPVYAVRTLMILFWIIEEKLMILI